MKLRTREFGNPESPKIVMLHGWGLASDVFRSIVSYLAPRYRVILLDLPGYGLNNSIPANRAYGTMINLEETLPDNIIIMGWSLGGVLALRYTIMNPKRVRGLITVSSSPRFTSLPEEHWPGTPPELLIKLQSLLTQDNVYRVIDRFLSLQAMGSPTMKNDIREIKDLLKDVPLPSYYELQAGLKTLADEDLRGCLTRVECPALHLYGVKDRLVPYQGSSVWPVNDHSLIHVFQNSSHAPFISEPESFRKILLDFLDKYAT
ncbi:alpha/beta fold hydrolase [Succinimonas amylolytica]|uniref:alpha/beta fold hydrolase n=1 Tax=Succinimonas amylolytica TaxID=83769 RepID=UPI0023A819E2